VVLRHGEADGLVGSLHGLHRHYRFEVVTSTTIGEFASALRTQAFADD